MTRDAQRAVRIVGLKLLLLSASLAALAQVSPAAAGADLASASWAGMKLTHLIVGTMSAGASLFFLPQFTGMALGRTVTCGIVCAVVCTPLAWWGLNLTSVKYLGAPLPGDAENPLAAAFGVGGVFIIPMLQGALEAFRKNPWAIIDRLRGKPSDDAGRQP